MVEFQSIAWEPRDTDEGFTITAYGRTKDGKSVSATTLFQPYFFIQIPNWTTPEALWAEFKQNLSNPKLELAHSVPMMGFTNNEKKKFMKLSFKTHEEMRKFVWRCKNKKLRVFESNIDPLLRFLHRTGIESVGWMTVENSEPDFSTTCDIRIFTPDWKNFKPVANDSLAPFRICSLDIECYSSTGIFPNPDVSDDDLFQIALTTSTYGTGDSEQICFSLGEVSGPNIVQCSDEKDLLTKFSEYIIKHDPDVITGWNVFGFDFEYIYKRMIRAKCEPYTRCLGRRLDSESEIVIKNLSSGALGANVLKMLPMVGRYTFDLFQTVKAEHKLESYSLNAVSLNFLGDRKNDMPIKQMFKMYKEKQDLSEIALYCIKDTELPIKIMEKLKTFENLVEMAKATWVPLSFLSERGQQIKVFSQIAKKARELGFMVPTIFDKPTVSQFEGATVLDAQCGAYYNPIVGLDFAGLYPSIMIAHNLCYSTLVMDEKYANIPGVEYERYGDHVFAQGVPSLLPAVLNDLKMFRKKAKQDMKKAKGTPMESIYDGKQLAYKISMNSIYGFTGASNGILPCVAIASTVTCRGRQMIQASKKYVEEHFPGAKVRYGDSVMPGTPVITKSGPVCIESLGTVWDEYPGFMKDGIDKEKAEIDIQVWTHMGWQNSKRVIRHKCQKKIYRVLTHTGLVDVTEDHSLLDTCVNELKPKNVYVGTELLHSFPEEFVIDTICSKEQAYIYGIFVGDGSCGKYDSKYSWAINNADMKLLEKCKEILENIYKKRFKILDTIDSSGVYKLVPSYGDMKTITNEYRTLCYDGLVKKIPICVLGNEETKNAFLDGLWDSDGCRKDFHLNGCHRIDTKNQVTAQWYYILLRQLGYSVSLNTRTDKSQIYRLTWTNGIQRKNPNKVKKIFILHEQYDGYVYDIETEAGTFQAGIGQMIVKNTDSVMVEFDVGNRKGQEAIDYSWELGEQAAEQITQIFKRPNELELEKVYCPYFLYSKKRYAAKKWVKNETTKLCEFVDVEIKGLQVVRRDNCQFVRDTCRHLVDMLMESSNPEKPLRFIMDQKNKLKKGQVPMSELVLSKRLGDSYKNTNLAHVVVRDKMRERAPGSEPRSGDRVQFVVIQTPKNMKKMYEKAEDPAYVTEHGIPLDYEWYVKHQFDTPVKDLIEPLVN